MTPDEMYELEQQMDALAREYAATHDPKIFAELNGQLINVLYNSFIIRHLHLEDRRNFFLAVYSNWC